MTLRELIDQQHPIGIPIRIDVYLTGSRKALWDGSNLYVSPAMASLFDDETVTDTLFDSLTVVYIPAWKPVMPLTQCPPRG